MLIFLISGLLKLLLIFMLLLMLLFMMLLELLIWLDICICSISELLKKFCCCKGTFKLGLIKLDPKLLFVWLTLLDFLRFLTCTGLSFCVKLVLLTEGFAMLLWSLLFKTATFSSVFSGIIFLCLPFFLTIFSGIIGIFSIIISFILFIF